MAKMVKDALIFFGHWGAEEQPRHESFKANVSGNTCVFTHSGPFVYSSEKTC